MKLDDLQVYQLSINIAERIWKFVVSWDYFLKDTIIKRTGNFVIIQEDHYLKLKHG